MIVRETLRISAPVQARGGGSWQSGTSDFAKRKAREVAQRGLTQPVECGKYTLLPGGHSGRGGETAPDPTCAHRHQQSLCGTLCLSGGNSWVAGSPGRGEGRNPFGSHVAALAALEAIHIMGISMSRGLAKAARSPFSRFPFLR